jgi:hypothetical protein
MSVDPEHYQLAPPKKGSFVILSCYAPYRRHY